MTIAYHETRNDMLQSVLRDGLKRTSRGEKGSNDRIVQTDKLVDEYRPEHITRAGVSRNNLYCYFSHNGKVIDITTGESKTPTEVSASPEHSLLQIYLDPSRCYVSDLDRYDSIVRTIKNDNSDKAAKLAIDYWQCLTRLDKYDHTRGFARPEVMVTYDIPPALISTIK